MPRREDERDPAPRGGSGAPRPGGSSSSHGNGDRRSASAPAEENALAPVDMAGDRRVARLERREARLARRDRKLAEKRERDKNGVGFSFPARLTAVLILMALLTVGLVARLFSLQALHHEEYLGKVLRNVSRETPLAAHRGEIYSADGQKLASNLVTYRVFISPDDIAGKPTGASEIDEDLAGDPRLIADTLGEILGIDPEQIYAATQREGRRDETIAKNVGGEQADKIRAFIDRQEAAGEGYSRMIHLEETVKRQYDQGSLAAQVIGVMGTDGGLFGLEMQYEEALRGEDGITRYSRSNSEEGFEENVPARDGYDLHTTLDTNVQRTLEEQLKATYEENNAKERACGVVMDVKTGGVLAMATYPTFDLNDPYTLVGEFADRLAAQNLTEGSDEYRAAYNDLLYEMWNNKTISDDYNPGSTFKVMTSAAALNEGVITPASTFTCTGRWVDNTGTTRIACASTGGHGTHDFTYMLQQSCNPTLIQVSMLLGRERFLRYFNDFGFTEPTGIDLPSELVGVSYDPSAFSIIDLAVSAFGQGFTTTALQEITAVSAVANGGELVRPHIVESITDSAGNVVWSFEGGERRQVVSRQACETVTQILADGVSGDGGARNAYVAGYNIAAKTGTSEKKTEVNPLNGEYDLRVGSCVGYAPAEDPQVSVIIVVDEPNTDGRSSRAGGVVAAPYIAGTMASILPYLGIERAYSDEELANLSMPVGDYLTKPVSEVQSSLDTAGIEVKVVGSGETVLAQLPAAGETVSKAHSHITLFTELREDGSVPYENATVPEVTGLSVRSAISRLTSEGFCVNITGAVNYDAGSGAIVASQDHTGEVLPKGSVVTVECVHTDVDDAA